VPAPELPFNIQAALNTIIFCAKTPYFRSKTLDTLGDAPTYRSTDWITIERARGDGDELANGKLMFHQRRGQPDGRTTLCVD
jgi:hypothetical protein